MAQNFSPTPTNFSPVPVTPTPINYSPVPDYSNTKKSTPYSSTPSDPFSRAPIPSSPSGLSGEQASQGGGGGGSSQNVPAQQVGASPPVQTQNEVQNIALRNPNELVTVKNPAGDIVTARAGALAFEPGEEMARGLEEIARGFVAGKVLADGGIVTFGDVTNEQGKILISKEQLAKEAVKNPDIAVSQPALEKFVYQKLGLTQQPVQQTVVSTQKEQAPQNLQPEQAQVQTQTTFSTGLRSFAEGVGNFFKPQTMQVRLANQAPYASNSIDLEDIRGISTEAPTRTTAPKFLPFLFPFSKPVVREIAKRQPEGEPIADRLQSFIDQSGEAQRQSFINTGKSAQGGAEDTINQARVEEAARKMQNILQTQPISEEALQRFQVAEKERGVPRGVVELTGAVGDTINFFGNLIVSGVSLIRAGESPVKAGAQLEKSFVEQPLRTVGQFLFTELGFRALKPLAFEVGAAETVSEIKTSRINQNVVPDIKLSIDEAGKVTGKATLEAAGETERNVNVQKGTVSGEGTVKNIFTGTEYKVTAEGEVAGVSTPVKDQILSRINIDKAFVELKTTKGPKGKEIVVKQQQKVIESTGFTTKKVGTLAKAPEFEDFFNRKLVMNEQGKILQNTEGFNIQEPKARVTFSESKLFDIQKLNADTFALKQSEASKALGVSKPIYKGELYKIKTPEGTSISSELPEGAFQAEKIGKSRVNVEFSQEIKPTLRQKAFDTGITQKELANAKPKGKIGKGTTISREVGAEDIVNGLKKEKEYSFLKEAEPGKTSSKSLSEALKELPEPSRLERETRRVEDLYKNQKLPNRGKGTTSLGSETAIRLDIERLQRKILKPTIEESIAVDSGVSSHFVDKTRPIMERINPPTPVSIDRVPRVTQQNVRFSTKQEPIQSSVNRFSTQTNSVVDQGMKDIQTEAQTQRKTETFSFGQSQENIQTSRTGQEQIFSQLQKNIQDQLRTTDIGQRQRIREPPVRINTKSKSSQAQEKQTGEEAYIPQIRRKGKFADVSTEPLTRKEAIELAESIAENSAARSFRLRKVPAIPRKQEKTYNVHPYKFYRSKREKDVYVQKSKFSIGTQGEKKEITQEGIRAVKNKAVFGKDIGMKKTIARLMGR